MWQCPVCGTQVAAHSSMCFQCGYSAVNQVQTMKAVANRQIAKTLVWIGGAIGCLVVLMVVAPVITRAAQQARLRQADAVCRARCHGGDPESMDADQAAGVPESERMDRMQCYMSCPERIAAIEAMPHYTMH